MRVWFSNVTEIIGTVVDAPAGSVECWHCHGETQLLFPLSGTLRVEFPEQSWDISPQCALWIPPQTPHEGVFCTNVRLCALYFRDESSTTKPAEEPTQGRLDSRPRVSLVSPLLREVIIALARIGGCSGSAKDERIRLLTGLLANEAENCSISLDAIELPRNERLRRICTRMIARLTDEWTIDEFARQTAMSRRTFTRAFRAEMGVSFGEWLRAVRLRQAAAGLRSGKSVAAVAYEVGYASPAAFSASFRSYFGVAPSVF